jgi:uncharacterized protein (DUF2147 family)
MSAALAAKGMKMRRFAQFLAFAAAAAALAGPALADDGKDAESLFGSWRNPKNTVHVDIRKCGGATACGVVTWATAKAQADAKKGSGKTLIGMQLFQGLKPDKSGVWHGRVYVPDKNMTFAGSAEPIDGNTLRAKGCLFGNVLCKSQLWTRLD